VPEDKESPYSWWELLWIAIESVLFVVVLKAAASLMKRGVL
jgi:hypothetical protein